MPSLGLRAPLSDGVVTLRDLEERDLEPYAAAFAVDRDLGRLLGVEQDPNVASLRERRGRLGPFAADGRLAELAIADAATDAFLGSLTLHSLDWRNRRGELGFWIVPAARRRGMCERAVALALDWMFGPLDLDRAEMTTTPDNLAVAALAAKVGFTREGTMRSRNLERGRRVDVVMFALLREERQLS